jgi:ankyrin repeat protein
MNLTILSDKIYKQLERVDKAEDCFRPISQSIVFKYYLSQLAQFSACVDYEKLEQLINCKLAALQPSLPEDLSHCIHEQLVLAIEEDDSDLLEAIIALHPDVINQPITNKKETPLMLAALEKHAALVKLLLATPGIDINFCNYRTALDEAVSAGDLGIVQELIKFGAIPTQNSLQIACSCGHLAITQELIKEKNQRELFDYNLALMQAVTFGHLPIVQYLVDNLGADVHYTEPSLYADIRDEVTPLSLAIQFRQTEVAQFLKNKIT